MDNRINDENKILQSILEDSKMGWWKAFYKQKIYIISDFIRKSVGLDSNITTFDQFIMMIREDYRARISADVNELVSHLFYDQTFPILTPNGEIWIRSRTINQEKDDDGYLEITGYIQCLPDPEKDQPDKASFLRVNNLLFQLNTISQTLLILPQTKDTTHVINQILRDILQVFKGGRAYIIEYDWKENTQTCTYEVADLNVHKEQSKIVGLPMLETPWWTRQICSGKPIVLSDLEELPAEATEEKEFLSSQDIKSMIVAPLIFRGQAWGYVGIDIVEGQHNWSKEDRQWFSSLANIINICIELQKSELEAQTDKQYLQNLYKYMPLGHIRIKLIYDENKKLANFKIIDANEAAQKIIQNSDSNHFRLFENKQGFDLSDQLSYISGIIESGQYKEQTFHLENIGKTCHAITYSIQQDEVICLLSDMTETFNTHLALDRSEKILRNIYDNLPVGIELYDKNGFLVDVNNKNMEIFGMYDKKDVIGINILQEPNLPEEIKEKIKRREPVSFRMHYAFDSIRDYFPTRKSGFIETYTTASPLYDTQGNLIHYLFIHIDNTEINRAYNQIAEFETSFSTVSKFGKIGYCKFDVFTKNGYGVPQWFRNLGEKETTPLPEIIGVYTYIHDEDRAYILDCIRRVKLKEIDSFSRDLRVNTKDGWKWTRINVVRNPMNTDPGKLEMICVNYDVTELKETERELIEAKNKAEISDRLKSAFLANMSHEIRTPLNAIVGFSNLLLDADEQEDRASYIKIIQENNELLLQLISDILDLSKIEAGTFEFNHNHVDVKQLCIEIVRSFSVKSIEKNVVIRLENDLPECRTTSDKNRLTQVITNFINNALKFTDEGSISLGFQYPDKDHIKIYVRDTGKGIPQEKLTSVFERFVKLNNFAQGTGLGLSICKSIIEQMEGTIGVESQLGQGSCFWFILPHSSLDPESEQPADSQALYLKREHNRNGKQAVILIAEDTDSNFLLFNSILKKEYAIIRAKNGLEAIRLYREYHPDLILMDVKMPEMDGIAATQEIRKENTTIPVIAVTAFAFDSDRQKALAAGCDDYIAKPIQADQFKEKIRNCLASAK